MPRFVLIEETPEANEMAFWCPGCKIYHQVRVRGPRPCWTWNGDTERPTLSPSYLLGPGTPSQCHSFITDGRIEFLGDCWHELRGQTVDLPECEW